MLLSSCLLNHIFDAFVLSCQLVNPLKKPVFWCYSVLVASTFHYCVLLFVFGDHEVKSLLLALINHLFNLVLIQTGFQLESLLVFLYFDFNVFKSLFKLIVDFLLLAMDRDWNTFIQRLLPLIDYWFHVADFVCEILLDKFEFNAERIFYFFKVFSILLCCIVYHLEGLVDLSYLLSGYIFIVYAPFHVLLLIASDLIP
jgi:hypothetical protein